MPALALTDHGAMFGAVVYGRLADAWLRANPLTAGGIGYGGAGGPTPAPGGPAPVVTTSAAGNTITGPILDGSPAAGPSEEALSGFSAAWALFHHVLPAAAASGSLDARSIAASARALDLPPGSLPNGAGLQFSSDPATLGQNTRAAAVIWQWQAVRSYAFVWPPAYATGTIALVPLAR